MSAASAGPGEVEGPILQSVRIGFGVLQLATLVLALAWATGNIREIGPGTQALVLRMGRIERVVPSGLAIAWPPPFERLVRLPSGERRMQMHVVQPPVATPSIAYDPEAGYVSNAMPVVAPDAATLLTGDGEIVRLDATLNWRISDAAAYYVAQDHVAAALRRLFLGAAVAIAADHQLDDFLSVRPERADDPVAQGERTHLRQEFVDAINARLRRLAGSGAPLGVEVARADITPLLPDEAKSSFDAVLDAAQRADQGLAVARTDAAQRRQTADRERDRLLTDAHAAADERIDGARAAVATIAAYEAQEGTIGRPALLQEIYRTRIGAVLRAAGRLDTVPPGGGAHLVMPSPRP